MLEIGPRSQIERELIENHISQLDELFNCSIHSISSRSDF